MSRRAILLQLLLAVIALALTLSTFAGVDQRTNSRPPGRGSARSREVLQ